MTGIKRGKRSLPRLSLGWLISLAIGVTAGALATAYLLGRPSDASVAPRPTLYRVGEGTVGRTLNLPLTASWPVLDTIVGQSGGVITELVARAGYVESGDVLMLVDERPVVVLEGDIPAFRSLEFGTTGRDVAALNAYLNRAGYATGVSSDEYNSQTRDAVAAWQADLGLASTGVVELGDIVYLSPSALAAPVRWAAGISTGASLTPGAPLLELLGSQPDLTIEFGAGSAPPELVPGLIAQATFESGDSRRLSVKRMQFDIGRRWADLGTADGSALCVHDDCLNLVPIDRTATVAAQFVLVPETAGPLVPAAAVRTDAGGQAFVEMADGQRRNVRIVVASGGSAIVDGVDIGESIVLP